MEQSACVQELWRSYTKYGRLSDKNALVMHYLPAVKRAALHLIPTYRAYCSYEDMVSSGVIGLMDAIEKYDASRDARFETYSALRIRGEILDSIRAQDWASDSLRRRLKTAERTQRELREKLGREPSENEVAARMNISEAALREALEKSRVFSMMYFEDMAAEGEAWEQSVPCAVDSPEEIAENKELAKALGNAIDRLPEKERLVISLYYYEELTQNEISAIIGVSESRVCQLRAGALQKLKTLLQRTC
jgi:RNA polymerase sigma factor, FliA/WhiG family/RNA polymerase sigma factor, sigma-70 family